VIVVAIDPGVTGALARFVGGELVDVRATPIDELRKGKSTRRSTSAAALAALLDDWAADVVVVEDVGAQGRNGALALWSLGHSKGVIEGVAAAQCRRLERVPLAWKRASGLSDDKGLSVRRAEERWPGTSWFRGPRGGPLDGHAEAALLGIWWLERGSR
jgi:hypothetical protein